MTETDPRPMPSYRYRCMDCHETTTDYTEAVEDHGQCFTVHPASSTHVVDVACPHGQVPHHMDWFDRQQMRLAEIAEYLR